MKILLLNTSARTGGAAVAANRLRKALQKKGIDVSMLVRDKEIADASISSVSSTGWKRKMNLFRFYWERLIIFCVTIWIKRTVSGVDCQYRNGY